MKRMILQAFLSAFAIAFFIAARPQDARIDNMNLMSNRISVNVTVPRQTQGTSIGERAHDGKINITLIENGCVVLFSSKTGYLVNIRKGTVSELTPSDFATYSQRVNQGLHTAGSAISQGASLLGGALPGGAIISAAVSSLTGISKAPGGAAAGSYARAGKADPIQVRLPDDKTEMTMQLPDGDYELSFIILEKTTSGVKDTLKTQVRLGFTSVSNDLKTKHDTVKNSISNIR